MRKNKQAAQESTHALSAPCGSAFVDVRARQSQPEYPTMRRLFFSSSSLYLL